MICQYPPFHYNQMLNLNFLVVRQFLKLQKRSMAGELFELLQPFQTDRKTINKNKR